MKVSPPPPPQVPGLPITHTPPRCAFLHMSSVPCFKFVMRERKLFLHPAVYETFSRHPFRAPCRCSFSACQLPRESKRRRRGRRDCSALALNESCPRFGHLCHRSSAGDSKHNPLLAFVANLRIGLDKRRPMSR